MTSIDVDMVIVGGGIAGLWTLATARAKGFNAILLESNTMGCGQTIHSQGIIHGGSKYALAGKISKATRSIADMPDIWLSAIQGTHPYVNLSNTNILSEQQYLIPTPGIDTKLLSFFGSKTMRSQTKKVAYGELAETYKSIGINTHCFQLNEIVINVHTALHDLYVQHQETIFQHHIDNNCLTVSKNPNQHHMIHVNDTLIKTPYIVFSCGEGLEKLTIRKTAMQRRPLHMLTVSGTDLPLIYAHFIGRSTKPLLTITSHQTDHGVVWYLGGGIAEEGVSRSQKEQIAQAKQLLRRLMPTLTMNENVTFNSLTINRAEPKQSGLSRPDNAWVKNVNNIIYGWPTKLALAPVFAEKVMQAMNIKAASQRTDLSTIHLPKPTIADYPWHSN